MARKKRVLFLCTGNSCRSQMADGIVNHDFSDKVTAVSAGTNPHGLNPRAVQVMDEINIDISRNSSDHLNRYQEERFDYVISLCDDADDKCPSALGGVTRLHMPFEDPPRATGSEEEVLRVYRRVRDEIRLQLNTFFEQALKNG
jgi:arsenate reductase